LSIALPLHLPSPRSVLITGVACADSIDQERMRFAPRSLTFLPWMPPLLYRHRDDNRGCRETSMKRAQQSTYEVGCPHPARNGRDDHR
jgi:hypothetical protein